MKSELERSGSISKYVDVLRLELNYMHTKWMIACDDSGDCLGISPFLTR